jgi:hypothetical protein
MPRKHGARAAADVKKRVAKSKGVPQTTVKPFKRKGRVSTRPRFIGSAEPGSHVKSRYGESVDGMMKRLKYGEGSKSRARRIKPVPKGVVKKGY